MLLLLYSYYFDRGSDLSLDMNSLLFRYFFYTCPSFSGTVVQRKKQEFLFSVIVGMSSMGRFSWSVMYSHKILFSVRFPRFYCCLLEILSHFANRGFCCADLFAMESSTPRGELFLSTHQKGGFFVKYDAVIW